jgi:hypothetical protein
MPRMTPPRDPPYPYPRHHDQVSIRQRPLERLGRSKDVDVRDEWIDSMKSIAALLAMMCPGRHHPPPSGATRRR